MKSKTYRNAAKVWTVGTVSVGGAVKIIVSEPKAPAITMTLKVRDALDLAERLVREANNAEQLGRALSRERAALEAR